MQHQEKPSQPNKKADYTLRHLRLSTDSLLRFKVLAAGKGLSHAEMFAVLVNYYWNHAPDKETPLIKGRGRRIKRVIEDVLRKAAGES